MLRSSITPSSMGVLFVLDDLWRFGAQVSIAWHKHCIEYDSSDDVKDLLAVLRLAS
jgi:hypothetical protein